MLLSADLFIALATFHNCHLEFLKDCCVMQQLSGHKKVSIYSLVRVFNN